MKRKKKTQQSKTLKSVLREYGDQDMTVSLNVYHPVGNINLSFDTVTDGLTPSIKIDAMPDEMSTEESIVMIEGAQWLCALARDLVEATSQ